MIAWGYGECYMQIFSHANDYDKDMDMVSVYSSNGILDRIFDKCQWYDTFIVCFYAHHNITDGLVDSVFYGIPDWVYEEEVLGVNYAHYVNG